MGAHHHHHGHSHGEQDSKNILTAFALNFTFSIIEFIGGAMTNSVAIISDAVHDLGDSLALLFTYFATKISHKKADDIYTYGYRRFTIMAAMINGLILFSGSIFVIKEAAERLQSPEAVKPEGMVLLAVMGIVVNSIAAYKMSKGEGVNQKMVMLHLLEDLMGWIAVLIVSIILLFKPWYILDSILSILISFVILRGVYFNLKKVVSVILQKFPDEISIKDIEKEIRSYPEVLGIHHIRGWSIDDTSFSITLHVQVEKTMQIGQADLLRAKITNYLKKLDVTYTNIQVESDASSCHDDK